jgi:hypothetical protein
MFGAHFGARLVTLTGKIDPNEYDYGRPGISGRPYFREIVNGVPTSER